MAADRYANEEKQAARKLVHALLKAAITPNGKLILLAGHSRQETDIAVDMGWLLENIIHVDFNNYQMANFVRKFHGLEREIVLANRYNEEVSEVCKILVAQGGHADAIHLDFTDPIENIKDKNKPRWVIERVIASGIMDKGLLAVTVLSGRVAIDAVPAFRQDMTREELIAMRRMFLTHAVKRGCERRGIPFETVIESDYFNDDSVNRMLWSVFKLG